MTRLRTAVRVGRFVVAALDALGRARLSRDGLEGRARRLHAACAEIATIHQLQLAIHGTLPTGAAVIVTNHVSYLDAIAVSAALPCTPIAKGEVERWPIIGPAARQLGVIFVDRSSPWSRIRALRRAYDVLASGVPVLNFPEGTTTDGSRLMPFAPGIFGLARLAGVPVVPVAVRCARELAWFGAAPFVPHYLRTTSLEGPAIRLEVGRAIDPTRFLSDGEVAAVAHQRIAYMLRDQIDPTRVVAWPKRQRARVPA